MAETAPAFLGVERSLSGRRWIGPSLEMDRLAETIAQETDVIQIIAPWLTLDGLRVIWELNQKGK